MKRAMHNGDEQDAFSRFGKRFLHWRPGERKAIKRRANRRERREVRQYVRLERGGYPAGDLSVSDFPSPPTDMCVYREASSFDDETWSYIQSALLADEAAKLIESNGVPLTAWQREVLRMVYRDHSSLDDLQPADKTSDG